MTTWNREINRRIEEIRIRRGIPRTKVARAAGIKADTYRDRILEGRSFSVDQLAAIAQQIDINFIAMLTEVERDLTEKIPA